MKLNFSFSELLYSNTAEQYRIKNIPDLEEADNLLELIVYCLQPIRDKLNKPMIVSSGYRCEELNNKIGGVKNSQHTKGQAVDFKVKGMTAKEVINFIVDNDFEFDQLINEHDMWVHISYAKGKNRKQILKIS
jgi:hypothetical protein